MRSGTKVPWKTDREVLAPRVKQMHKHEMRQRPDTPERWAPFIQSSAAPKARACPTRIFISTTFPRHPALMSPPWNLLPLLSPETAFDLIFDLQHLSRCQEHQNAAAGETRDSCTTRHTRLAAACSLPQHKFHGHRLPPLRGRLEGTSPCSQVLHEAAHEVK